MKNGTLPEAYAPFVSTLRMTDTATTHENSFDLRVHIHDGEARVARLQPATLPLALLALLRLPALRKFWIRELRRNHFRRLERVLPRVWFVIEDPPVGAVIPGLNATSWREIDGRAELARVEIDGVKIVVESLPESDIPMKLSYRFTETA